MQAWPAEYPEFTSMKARAVESAVADGKAWLEKARTVAKRLRRDQQEMLRSSM